MNRRTFIMGVAGAASIGGLAVSTASDGQRTESVNHVGVSGTFDAGDELVREFDLPDGEGTARADIYVDVQYRAASDGFAGATLTVENAETGNIVIEDPVDVTPSYHPGDSRTYRGVAIGDVWGDSLQVTLSVTHGTDAEFFLSWGATVVPE